jgi:predicted secreted Zn-dependent protease
MLESIARDGLEWRRSSRCNGGACVEVAAGPDLVYVRNSADPKGSMLVLSRARWADLIARVKERRGLEA